MDVRGVANDAVEGYVGAPEPTASVSVNGVPVTGAPPARVSDRYFLVPGVPLEVGANSIVVTAKDHLGNERSREIQVTRVAVR